MVSLSLKEIEKIIEDRRENRMMTILSKQPTIKETILAENTTVCI